MSVRDYFETTMPAYVSRFRDRHGVMRYRFRRGSVCRYIGKDITTPEFQDLYRALMDGTAPPPAWPKQSVYFITDGFMVKIGVAKRPECRLREMQVGHASQLRLLATTEGGVPLERRYHQRFAAHRIRGEWFRLCPEIKAEVERLNEALAA